MNQGSSSMGGGIQWRDQLVNASKFQVEHVSIACCSTSSTRRHGDVSQHVEPRWGTEGTSWDALRQFRTTFGHFRGGPDAQGRPLCQLERFFRRSGSLFLSSGEYGWPLEVLSNLGLETVQLDHGVVPKRQTLRHGTSTREKKKKWNYYFSGKKGKESKPLRWSRRRGGHLEVTLSLSSLSLSLSLCVSPSPVLVSSLPLVSLSLLIFGKWFSTEQPFRCGGGVGRVGGGGISEPVGTPAHKSLRLSFIYH